MANPTHPPSGASSAAIQHHYDVSDDFYRLWLDPTLCYSCALWADGEPDEALEKAQIRKIDYHAGQARANGAASVLDVGCGWGALVRRLVENYGVGRAVGLTLSKRQAAHVAAMGQPKIDVHLQSWMDHAPEQPYDAVISVGAFEHFARADWDDAAKVQAYRAFFEHCQSWLKPDGRLSLQSIAYGNIDWDEAKDAPGREFFSEVFPESELPTLENILAASRGLFEIVTLRNDGQDYHRTCRVWLKRLKARRTEAVALVGEPVVERYLRYLKLSAVLFEHRRCYLYRIAWRRIDPLRR
jgi:cyclopropane-fatty-acyl-phospholipid synthase